MESEKIMEGVMILTIVYLGYGVVVQLLWRDWLSEHLEQAKKYLESRGQFSFDTYEETWGRILWPTVKTGPFLPVFGWPVVIPWLWVTTKKVLREVVGKS